MTPSPMHVPEATPNPPERTHGATEPATAEATALGLAPARLHSLIDSIPDLLWLKSIDGVYLECNRRFASRIGVERSALLGRTAFEFVPHTDAAAIAAEDQLIVESVHPVRSHAWATFADGHREYLETVKSPMRNEAGEVVGIIGVARDQTAFVEWERRLRESESQLRRAQALSKTGSWSVDLRRKVTTVSAETCRFFGVERGEEITLEVAQAAVPPEDLQRVIEAWVGLLAGQPFNLEHRMLVHGEVRWIRSIAELEIGDDGRKSRVLGVFTDITDYKTIESELARRERVYGLIAATSRLGIVLVDPRTLRFVEVNDTACTSLGYTREELGRLSLEELELAGQPEHFRERLRQAMEREDVVFESTIRRKDGTAGDFEIRLHRVHVGELVFLASVFTDISERRRTQEELRRHRSDLEGLVQQRTAELTAVFRALPDLYFRTDRDGVVLDFLSRDDAEPYVRPEAMLGRRLQDVLPPDVGALVEGGLAEMASGKATVELEYRLAVEGAARSYEARMLPLGPDQLVIVVRDVTERRRAQLALGAARDAAEAANRAKSAFLANMSHEIRTPMNAIVGLTHLLHREEKDPHHREQLEKVIGAAHHLLSIVNDLLDLSKIEAGKLELETSDFEVKHVVDEVSNLVADRLDAKKVGLKIDLVGVPPVVRGDSLRVRQVLLNFAGNAAKFTDRGRVTIRVRAKDRTPERCRIRFEVIDTGIGLSEEQVPRLFLPFEQADASVTRKHGGTGLGLAIAKRLSEAMGGEVGCTSQVGKGSTFWFEVPLAIGEERRSRPSASSQSLPGGPAVTAEQACAALARRQEIRVLLVEDNALNREVALELLAAVGVTAETATNGLEAVELGRTHAFDLVLMDVQMPVLNGLEATRLLRTLPIHRSTPILAMTASAFDDDREACLRAGMNAHVAKPVDPEALYRAVLEWLPIRNETTTRLTSDLEPSRTVPRQPAAPATAVEASTIDRLRAVQGLDLSRGLRTLGGDEAHLVKLLEQFCVDHRAEGARLGEALAADDCDSAGRIAHTLKGLAATLGMNELQVAAAGLELAIRKGQALGTLTADARALDVDLRQLVDRIQAALPKATAASASGPTMDRGELSAGVARLRKALEDDDLGAGQLARPLVAALQALDGEAATKLGREIDRFAYKDALATLARFKL